MEEGTKERILRIALELFAQNGYLGTSMNDIAGQLGFTKAALYKHYASKQEILDKIVERMNKMDYERAEIYEMPETEPDGFAEAYLHTPIQKIRTYSLAQFDHWTKEPFSSKFRKMLTLEQYRDPKLYDLVKEALIKCGRQDLIGFGKECLIAPRNIKQGRNTNTQYAKKHNDSSNTRQHRSDSKGRYSAGKRRK